MLFARLAERCLNDHITCVTFNYDDFFDEALWEVKRVVNAIDQEYWHPDGGYGFFCRQSSYLLGDMDIHMDLPRMLFLKLHGSINWRTVRGSNSPKSDGSVVRDENWYRYWPQPLADRDEEAVLIPAVLAQLDPNPFLVPPTLTKADLASEPILSLIWWRAYEALRNAQMVAFVGYSLPPTDFAAPTLFKEALRDLPPKEIYVVDIESASSTVQQTYRRVFPELSDEQFFFGGAVEWVR